MVFQNYALFPHLSVRGNVGFGLRMRGVGRAESRRRVDEALRLVQLSPYADRLPGQLSGGQQQRVAIARALISQPSVVFADEPTGALDSATAAGILGLLSAAVHGRGTTVVMVTHDPVAAACADRVVFLADGRVAGELRQPSPGAVADRMTRLARPGTAGTAGTDGPAPATALAGAPW
jgi:putative ABC transport system ATP-binding protein